MLLKTSEKLWTLFAPILVIGFWLGMEALLNRFSFTHELLQSTPLLKTLPYLLGALIVLKIENWRAYQGWRDTLSDFGFKTPKPVQLKIMGYGIAVLAAGYSLAFYLLGEAPRFRVNWPMVALKFLLEAGLLEELLYRGFLFRKLRAQHSFYRSAAISGIVFGSIHLINLANGFTMDVAISVAISVTFGFLMTFPFAALFEVGAGSLAGGVLFHFAVDTVNLLQDPSSEVMLICLFTAVLAGLTVFVLSRKRV